MAMKESHRLFLRTMMSTQFVPEAEIQGIYKQSCEAYDEGNDISEFQAFLHVVNKSLRPLFMEIRHGQSEEDGNVYYGLVNNVEDEHSKLATDYTANDIAFFKKAMDLIIISSDDGSVSSMDLVNAANDLDKRMLFTYTETLLQRLVNDKWLHLDEAAGIYSLGNRAMLELSQGYLKKIYEDDIVNCMMCKQISVKGQTCLQCNGKLHKWCAAVFFSKSAQRTCPNRRCSAPWTHDVPRMPAPKSSKK